MQLNSTLSKPVQHALNANTPSTQSPPQSPRFAGTTLLIGSNPQEFEQLISGVDELKAKHTPTVVQTRVVSLPLGLKAYYVMSQEAEAGAEGSLGVKTRKIRNRPGRLLQEAGAEGSLGINTEPHITAFDQELTTTKLPALYAGAQKLKDIQSQWLFTPALKLLPDAAQQPVSNTYLQHYAWGAFGSLSSQISFAPGDDPYDQYSEGFLATSRPQAQSSPSINTIV